MIIGYARRSKGNRDALGIAKQREAILAAHPDADVRVEIKSGGRADNRPVLAGIRRDLRRGDALVVARLDRLSRSLRDFADIVDEAQRRGWALVVLDQGFDMLTANGEAMAGMLAVFAQWERRIMGERIKEALAVKRARGWDPRRLDPQLRNGIVRLHSRGLSQRAIAARLGTHKETVARVLRQCA